MIIENTDRYWIDIMTLRTEMKFREFTKESMEKYEQNVKFFLEFTNKNSWEITEQDAREYLKSIEIEGMEQSTLYQKETYIDFFYKNCLGIDRYKLYKRAPSNKEYLSLEEVEKIIEVSNIRQKCIFTLLWNGLKLKEIVEIQLEDFDTEENTLKIGNERIGVDKLKENLQEYLSERDSFGDGYLFVKLGRRVSEKVIKKEFQKIKEILDIQKEITAEELRFSHGKILFDNKEYEKLMKLLRYEKKQSIILKYGGGRTDITE